MLKILHTADWHIKDSNIDECTRMVNLIVEHAIVKDPDLIILAADLTDRNDVKFDSSTTRLLFRAFYQLSRIAPIAMIGGTYFHDGKIPDIFPTAFGTSHHNIKCACNHPQQLVMEDHRLSWLDDFENEQDMFHNPQAVISLIPAPTKQFLKNAGTMKESDTEIAGGMSLIMANMGAVAAKYDCPHIGVGHWSIGGAMVSEKQMMVGRDIEISRTQLGPANFDLLCLGHIHKAQRIGPHPWFYSGSIYSLDAGELDDKGFFLHSLTDKQVPVKSEFITLPSTKRLIVEADFTEDTGELVDLDAVLYTYSEDEIKGNHVKISLRAWQDQAEQMDKDVIESFFISAGAESAAAHIIRVPRENVRCKTFLELKTTRDKLQEMANMRDDGDLSPGILEKIEMLETMSQEDILKTIPKA